jgi:poly(glycerol-phosphate) alpha-glucosyltransferase
MIYNFNLGIGWASSGVEYAQAYRAKMFRAMGEPARFIFTDMFPQENIEHFTKNLGFEDSEVIWLYTYFTDFHTAPVTYTLEQFQETIAEQDYRVTRNGKTGRLQFTDHDAYCTLYFVDERRNLLHRVEYVSQGCLIRKDYFTYGRIYSEYYAPLDGRAHLYLRRFFNEDGSVAYEEMPSGKNSMFRFADQLFFSKEELVGYFVRSLGLTGNDVLLVDRTTGIGQAIFENAGQARVGIVVHADHYSASSTNDTHILWNNYYEYPFDMYRHISFFVASTEAQKKLMDRQFAHYLGTIPKTVVVPVGGLDCLAHPTRPRRAYSVVTASRLATEKHIDWVIEACVQAKERVPGLTLDICGEGSERTHLLELIEKRGAKGYINLLGQMEMSEVYPNYELYLSGSTSEGFGLSLMEAVGSGLAMIGFDVPYGNPTFIDDEKNGYLIPVSEAMSDQERVQALATCVEEYFLSADRAAFEQRSYEIAEAYLTERVVHQWNSVIQS